MAQPARRPPPHVQMREMLAEARREGVPFESAWTTSLKKIKWPYDTSHRRQWREALESSRTEFQCCYEGRPSRVCEIAAALASAMEGREGVDRNDYELVAAA